MKRLFFLILLLISTLNNYAQPYTVDGIIAIVGKEIIMKSDIEKAYAEYAGQYAVVDDAEEMKCTIFERKSSKS